MKANQATRGVTLIELCFGLGLLAVLAGLAAPEFRSSLRASAVRAATFEVLAGVHQARAHSILQGRPGMLCPSDALGQCRAARLPGSEWTAFLADAGAAMPFAGQRLPRGVTLHASRSPLQFWPHSFSASPGTLTICDSQGIAAPRAVVVSISGRARVSPASPSACRS